MSEVTNEENQKFPKNVYVEQDPEFVFEGDNEFVYFSDLDDSSRGTLIAVYELKSIGVTGTRIRNVKAVK